MGRIVHLHGRAKDAAFRMAISDYANRLSGEGVSLSEHRNHSDPETYFLNCIKAGESNVILLEEKGEILDSIGYSEKLKQWRLSTNDVHLVVGPPGGFGDFSAGMSSYHLFDYSTSRTGCSCVVRAIISSFYNHQRIALS